LSLYPDGPLFILLNVGLNIDKLSNHVNLKLSDLDASIINDLGPVGRDQSMKKGLLGAM